MALKKANDCLKKFALKMKTEITTKRVKVILSLFSIVCVICLLLLFYETPNILGQIKTTFALKQLDAKYEKCDFDEKVIHRVTVPFRGISVEVSCPFLDRVRVLNVALDHLRLEHLRKRHSKQWKHISASEDIKLISGADDNFFQQLDNFSQIETVFLPWIYDKSRAWTSLEDKSNILLNKYFEWTADKEFCQWINNQVKNPFRYDVVYNRTCVSDIQKTKKPQALRLLALNSKPLNREFYWPNNGTSYPSHFYSEPPGFAVYLHMIEDCIVTPNSEVWSGNMCVVHRTCIYSRKKTPPPNIDKIPLYDEVIVLSQQYGGAVAHKMIEVIPRLSLYIDFLRRNPQIKILAPEKHGRTAEILTILGLSKNRIITGICRVKLLYFPRPTMCTSAKIQEIQVLSLLYRNYINENLKTEPRDKIILIRRSGRRKFTEHAAIERMVKETAATHNLSFALFPDNPVPSLKKTMIMFHSAVMVVAPHGAGLSNVVFSQPGTYVIEGVCNPPLINLCFQGLSYVLGHHWHGIHSLGGCMAVVNASVSTLKAAVEKHLDSFRAVVDKSLPLEE